MADIPDWLINPPSLDDCVYWDEEAGKVMVRRDLMVQRAIATYRPSPPNGFVRRGIGELLDDQPTPRQLRDAANRPWER